jgi:hypothetical protein
MFAWGFAHLLHHPNYLNCLQAELDEVIGNPEQIITMADRTKLPYTNAVVNVEFKENLHTGGGPRKSPHFKIECPFIRCIFTQKNHIYSCKDLVYESNF